MADYLTAFDKLIAHEGGYSNDPIDKGGETYKGISRVHYPDWAGWKRIDKAKKTAGFRKSLTADKTLQNQVKKFYKLQYWDRLLGDEITDQDVAEEVFDTGVNTGLRRAVKYLQEAINLLDRNASPDSVVVDGWMGSKTLKKLTMSLKKDKTNEFVMRLLNIMQGYRYIEIMQANTSQERFARGWLRRVGF